mmetsp:Transcript_5205/g.12535  ORF Transcript_5205/g.12535 Transcript_5205/m.12535 type:complete len:821 (-) Transcript_5205:58-2520(-)
MTETFDALLSQLRTAHCTTVQCLELRAQALMVELQNLKDCTGVGYEKDPTNCLTRYQDVQMEKQPPQRLLQEPAHSTQNDAMLPLPPVNPVAFGGLWRGVSRESGAGGVRHGASSSSHTQNLTAGTPKESPRPGVLRGTSLESHGNSHTEHAENDHHVNGHTKPGMQPASGPFVAQSQWAPGLAPADNLEERQNAAAASSLNPLPFSQQSPSGPSCGYASDGSKKVRGSPHRERGDKVKTTPNPSWKLHAQRSQSGLLVQETYSDYSGVRDPDRVELGGEELLKAINKHTSADGFESTAPLTFRPWRKRNVSRAGSMVSSSTLRRKVIRSVEFDIFCALIITVNAVNVGIEVQLLSSGRDIPATIIFIDLAIVVWYSLELCLRVWADRISTNVLWNSFDCLMLVVSLLDIFVDVEQARGMSIVRFLRFVRVLRVLKMLKIGKTVNNYFLVFSKMTYCLLQSLPSLISAVSVIMIFTYITAVIITQAAMDYDGSDAQTSRDLQDYYGSLEKTSYSLVKAIFNGQSWGDLMMPLTHVSHVATVIFLAYLMLTLICFLNVVNGVFVDSALQSTAHYKELMVAQAQQKRIMLLQHLEDVFHEIDTDNSGYITVQEFDACLQTAGGRAFFEVVGLSTVQAYDLFRLIDVDGDHSVDIDEFANGCMTFMGEAKNFDIQCIIAENRQTLLKWNAFIDNFDAALAKSFAGILNGSPEQKLDRSRRGSNPTCGAKGAHGILSQQITVTAPLGSKCPSEITSSPAAKKDDKQSLANTPFGSLATDETALLVQQMNQTAGSFMSVDEKGEIQAPNGGSTVEVHTPRVRETL